MESDFVADKKYVGKLNPQNEYSPFRNNSLRCQSGKKQIVLFFAAGIAANTGCAGDDRIYN